MAIIGCISLWVMYLLLRKIGNKKIAIIGLAFFAICPWHIMKSKWGLESNLFPDLILYFIYFLIVGLADKKKYLFYLSFVFAGLSAYAYGTSYFFLPLFIIPLLIILIRKREISLKEAFISLLIIFIISLPIILFVIINTFDLPQINLPFMTIPRLTVNRYEEVTSIFSTGFIAKSINNFIGGLKILFLQNDGLSWNAISPFGTIYSFSIIFLVIGLLISIFNKSLNIKYKYIFYFTFNILLINLLIL